MEGEEQLLHVIAELGQGPALWASLRFLATLEDISDRDHRVVTGQKAFRGRVMSPFVSNKADIGIPSYADFISQKKKKSDFPFLLSETLKCSVSHSAPKICLYKRDRCFNYTTVCWFPASTPKSHYINSINPLYYKEKATYCLWTFPIFC